MRDTVVAPLTKRQAEILAFVRSYHDAHGYGPTLAEIGSAFGLTSLATVHKHLDNLRRKGRLQRFWNYSRSSVPLETCPTCGAKVKSEIEGESRPECGRLEAEPAGASTPTDPSPSPR